MQTFCGPVGSLKDFQQLDDITLQVLILVLTAHFTVNPLSVSGMHPVWFNVSKWEKGPSH